MSLGFLWQECFIYYLRRPVAVSSSFSWKQRQKVPASFMAGSCSHSGNQAFLHTSGSTWSFLSWLSSSHPQHQAKSRQVGLWPGGVSVSPTREFGVSLRQQNFDGLWLQPWLFFLANYMLDDQRRCSLQSVIQSPKPEVKGKLPFSLVVYLSRVCCPESFSYWYPGLVPLPWYLSVYISSARGTALKFVVLPL